MASATAKTQSPSNRTRRDIDPHSNDLHCIDVSTYEDVVWDKVPREKCGASFPKMIEQKQETVSRQWILRKLSSIELIFTKPIFMFNLFLK